MRLLSLPSKFGKILFFPLRSQNENIKLFFHCDQNFTKCFEGTDKKPKLQKIKYRKFHISSLYYVKSHQEVENEYAHKVMETRPAYEKSVIKDIRKFECQKLSGIPKELAEFEKTNSCEKEEKLKSENCLVFVYGTLKINEPNYDQMTDKSLGEATYVSLGKTVEKWPLVIASRYNIPFLLYKEGHGKNVIGQLFTVDKKMLSHMDKFECHPDYYTRMQVEVEVLESENVATGKIVTPWIYFLKNFRPELLELPFLENYLSRGSHGLEYHNRYLRSKAEDYYYDVKV